MVLKQIFLSGITTDVALTHNSHKPCSVMWVCHVYLLSGRKKEHMVLSIFLKSENYSIGLFLVKTICIRPVVYKVKV